MAVDERTPVIIGVGQFTERIDGPDYRGMSAVELATAAARASSAVVASASSAENKLFSSTPRACAAPRAAGSSNASARACTRVSAGTSASTSAGTAFAQQ